MVKSTSLEDLPSGIEDQTKDIEDVITRSSNALNHQQRKLSSWGLSKSCNPTAVVRLDMIFSSHTLARPRP